MDALGGAIRKVDINGQVVVRCDLCHGEMANRVAISLIVGYSSGGGCRNSYVSGSNKGNFFSIF